MQDDIQFNRWKREWVWAICYELLRDYPEQLTPPSTPAFSEEWMNYLDGLKENLHKHLKTLSFADVENRWKSMIVEIGDKRPFHFAEEDFYWEVLRPTESVLELYLSIFSCHIQKATGAFDYEFFNFTHKEMDQLFGWDRFMQ